MNQTAQQITSPQKKRTRADVLRDKVKIRLALDEAGPLIAGVLKENGIELPGADWSKVFPNWLIATVDDEVIGCLLVLPAKPVTYGEFLYTKPAAGFKLRAIAIRKLIAAGMTTAHQNGSSYVAGLVDFKNEKFHKILTQLNFVAVSPRMMMAKRLPNE